jgi:hypothetical protein
MTRLLLIACHIGWVCGCDNSGKVELPTGAEDTGTNGDGDGDGFTTAQDCDDGDATIHPDAEEVCDGVDNDCNGDIDDGVDIPIWYADADGDGYGDATNDLESCIAPSGHVEDSSDCDDTDAAIHPDAEEVCDGIDNNCNDDIDDGIDIPIWYTDADGDGYGDAASGLEYCIALSGRIEDSGDCDDTNAAIHPGLVEDCSDGHDTDCDGLLDCEDGECILEEICQEDCEDGDDNDLDGLTDCNDDDCWWIGMCQHPAGVRARVHGGEMWLTHESSDHHWSGGSYEEVAHHVEATGVWGTVQVLPPYVSNWSTATAQTTCTWSIDTVTGGSRFGDGSGGESRTCGATRSGFTITPGCRLSSSWFLPDGFAPGGANVNACTQTFTGVFTVDIGTLWYDGSEQWRSSESDSGSSQYSSWQRKTTWVGADIIGGNEYTAYH